MEMKIFVIRMHYNNNTKVGKVKIELKVFQVLTCGGGGKSN